MSEEETFLEKIERIARQNYFFIKEKKEEKEEDDGEYLIIRFEKIVGEKREIEIVFDKLLNYSIVRVDYRRYLSSSIFKCYAEIIFYPRMPNIDILLNHEHKHYLVMSIDIKFDIEKILQILFMLDYPEFWVWANTKSASLTLR